MNNLVSLIAEKTPTYPVTIPSTGKNTIFRPFLVKEEKILLMAQESNNDFEILQAIKDIVESCVEGIEKAENYPLFDVEYLFIQLRAKSVGEVVEPVLVCPETEENIPLKINLTEVDITENKDHKNTIQIADNIIVKMRYPSIKILQQRGENIDYTNPSSFYDLIADCVDSIQTKEENISVTDISKEELEEFIDCMTKEQFNLLLNFFITSPRLEYEGKYVTSDGKERTYVLSGLGDFFE
jgi:hypothetical protein